MATTTKNHKAAGSIYNVNLHAVNKSNNTRNIAKGVTALGVGVFSRIDEDKPCLRELAFGEIEDKKQFLELIEEHALDIVSLANSIRLEGLLQPIGVRDGGGGATYTIVFGNRRFLACLYNAVKLNARSPKVKATIIKGNSLDLLCKTQAENDNRVSLNPIERAKEYAQLIQAGLDVEEVSDRKGCSVQTIKNYLLLLELEPHDQAEIESGAVSASKAIAYVKSLKSGKGDVDLGEEDGEVGDGFDADSVDVSIPGNQTTSPEKLNQSLSEAVEKNEEEKPKTRKDVLDFFEEYKEVADDLPLARFCKDFIKWSSSRKVTDRTLLNAIDRLREASQGE